MVRTDENDVPNERSASIVGQIVEKTYLAPSHIQRWDNDLSNTHKE